MNKIINKIFLFAIVAQVAALSTLAVNADAYDDLNGVSFDNSGYVDNVGSGYSYTNYDPNTSVSYNDLNNTNFGGASTYYGTQTCVGCNTNSSYSQPAAGSGYSYTNYDPNTSVSYNDLNNTNFGGASTYYGTQTCVGCNTNSSYVTPAYENPDSSYISPSYSSGYITPSYGYSNVGYSNVGYSNYGYSSGGYTTGSVVNTLSCPSGTVQNGTICVNNVTGSVITNVNCPSGTIQNGNTCVNNITGPVVTNINCPSGTILTNGQCTNTVTPPVTTVTNCPSNTNYVNGTCQQIISPPVISYQTCWDGSRVPYSQVCPSQYKYCANGTSVPIYQACYVDTTPRYIPSPVVQFNNVVTSVATQITNTSGRCNGIGLIANNAPSTGWFEYGETPNLGRTTSSANIGSAYSAPFSNVLANLKPSTKYFCRAVMQNKYGVVKGEIVGFTTKAKTVSYVKPVAHTVTKKPVATKAPVKKNEVVCADGTTISVKSQSAATLLNAGQKLITVNLEKGDTKLVSNAVVSYKVAYKNVGDARLTGVVMKMTLPQEIGYVSSTAGTYDEASRAIIINQDSLDPYTEGTIIVTGKVVNNAPVGKSIVANVYVAYTVPGTDTQDEVTAYSVSSIVPATDLSNVDTGAKKVIGMDSERGFMPNSLIEWLALLAILFIIFILGRSIYASYVEDEKGGHH